MFLVILIFFTFTTQSNAALFDSKDDSNTVEETIEKDERRAF